MVDLVMENLKFNIENKGGVGAPACNRMNNKLVIGDAETFATNYYRSLLLQLNQHCTKQGDWKYGF
jgi:hypothetical protein